MPMNSVAPITYRFVVAHLAPGLLALYPLSLVVEQIKSLLVVATAGNAGLSGSLVILAIALVAGLIVDGLCFVSLDYLIREIRRRIFKQPTAKRNPETVEEFEMIDRIYSRTYAWKQFYASASFVLIVSFIFELHRSGLAIDSVVWLLVPMSIMLLFSSARSWANTESLLAKKFGVLEDAKNEYIQS
jgi:hypothetical protein